MRKEVKRDATVRLHRMIGQFEGIERMLEAEKPCVDVLMQVASARAALDRLANLLIAEHVENCLVNASEATCCPDMEKEEAAREVRKTLDRFLTSVTSTDS